MKVSNFINTYFVGILFMIFLALVIHMDHVQIELWEVEAAGRRDYDIMEIDITESDVAEFDITENDITESDITETNITWIGKLL